jgi:hypothetical protein
MARYAKTLFEITEVCVYKDNMGKTSAFYFGLSLYKDIIDERGQHMPFFENFKGKSRKNGLPLLSE